MNGITQTNDGYLWLATDGGLTRFDGVRFQLWKLPEATQALSVLGARDGSLWVGAQGVLYRLRDGKAPLMTYGGLARVDALLQDRAGAIWIGQAHLRAGMAGICGVGPTTLRCLTASVSCRYGAALALAGNGDLLAASDSGVCRVHGGKLSPFESVARPEHQVQGVTAIATAPDGTIFIGHAAPGSGGGLEQVTADGRRTAVMAPGFTGSEVSVLSLLLDRQGALWIGTIKDGLYHLANGRVDHISTNDGLSGNQIIYLYQDTEGSVWVATSNGLDRFHETRVLAFTSSEGLSGDTVHSVQPGPDGAIYIGNADSVDVLRGDRVTAIGRAEGLPGQTPTSLLVDHTGRVWIGVDNQLAVYSSGRFKPIKGPNGAPFGVVYDMIEDGRHDIWVLLAGAGGRIVRVRNDRLLDEIVLPGRVEVNWPYLDPRGNVWVMSVANEMFAFRNEHFEKIAKLPSRPDRLLIEADGTIYGFGRGGVSIFRRGRWRLYDVFSGLSCNEVLDAIEDHNGAFWLRTLCGIVVVGEADLLRWTSDSTYKPRLRILDAADGALPGRATFGPSAAIAPDGRLWFATDTALLSVDPAHVDGNLTPPRVHIERIVADHKALVLNSDLTLPPLTRDIQIDYAALSFVAPQKNRFQYRLLPVDKDWQDVGSRRSAFFSGLAPGDYVFEVKGANNDGVWNNRGDRLPFTIAAAFYQTLWFEAVVGFLLLLLVFLVVRIILDREVRQAELKFEERQAERARIARDLHDTLLQGVQGLIFRFEALAGTIPRDQPVHAELEAALDRADAVVKESRDRVADLRGVNGSRDFARTLEEAARRIFRRSGVVVRVTAQGAPRTLLPAAADEIQRIAEEFMFNTLKHAKARTLVIEIDFRRKALVLRLCDDGAGIDAGILDRGGREGHFGMVGMRERAQRMGARFTLRSRPGEGVELMVVAPGPSAYLGPRWPWTAVGWVGRVVSRPLEG